MKLWSKPSIGLQAHVGILRLLYTLPQCMYTHPCFLSFGVIEFSTEVLMRHKNTSSDEFTPLLIDSLLHAYPEKWDKLGVWFKVGVDQCYCWQVLLNKLKYKYSINLNLKNKTSVALTTTCSTKIKNFKITMATTTLVCICYL